MSYQFIDAYSSVLTADSSIVSGSGTSGTQRPIVNVGSVLVSIPVNLSGNTSVSGTVGASIIGGTVGASIIGLTPVTFSGSPSISGAVTVVGNHSVSGTLGASLVGQLPAGTANLGSIVATQGTTPWVVSSVYGNVSGSVLSQQLGTRTTSVVGSIPSSLLTGVYGHRNDAVASFLGGNLTWNPLATDSAGRPVVKLFAPEASAIRGRASLVSAGAGGSAIAITAPGAGLRAYITDAHFTNSGATTARLDICDSDGSIIGTTIAPAGGGSNLNGLSTPMTTINANVAVGIVSNAASSMITGYLYGYKAP